MPGFIGKRTAGTIAFWECGGKSASKVPLSKTNTVAPKPYYPTIRDLPDSKGRQILDCFLNLIYPETCFICSTPVGRRLDCGICAGCWNKAVALKIGPPLCSCCGLPFNSLDKNDEHLCGKCLLNMPCYSGARAFGYYTAELGLLIQELKFRGRRNLTGLLAPLLTSVYYEFWSRDEFDLIVPVPLHSKRKRERGYNQSELLAGALSAQIAIPCDCRSLVRVRSTIPQLGLSDSRRFENVQKAFRCENFREISGKRVLLIDDVMTTGATATSAAQALIEAGCLRVSVLTVARTALGS
jgi:ComF family protein